MMMLCKALSLVYVLLAIFTFIDGRTIREVGSMCQNELGECDANTYANVRLRALKSTNCADFCQCEYASTTTYGSVTYRWAKHTCSAGLMFDDNVKVCNWPSQVQCKNVVEEDCETEHGQYTMFKGEETPFLALKSSGCQKYCHCKPGDHMHMWEELECPAGLLFDDTISECNLRSRVQCDENGINDGTNNGGTDNGGTDNGENDNIGTGNGDTDNGGTDNGGTGNDGTDNEGTDNGENDNTGTENGTGDNGGTDNGNIVEEDCETEHGICTMSMSADTPYSALKSSGCTKYCHCKPGAYKMVWEKLACSAGLLFDNALSACTSPEYVQCNENDGTDNGATDNGGTDDGENDNTGTGNGNNDDGGTDNGNDNNGGTDNGEIDNGDTGNDGTDNGGSNNDGGNDNDGVVDNDGADDSDANNGNENNDFECYKCYKSDSNAECNTIKEVCESEKETCLTRVVWTDETYEISKGCASSGSSGSSDKSAKSSKGSSSKSTTRESDESSSDDSSEISSKESAKPSKEKSAKSSSSKGKSTKSSKEKSTKSSKEKSSKSSKEKSSKSSKEKSTSSSTGSSGCKKSGKKVTCNYECTSTLCNELLPLL